MQDRYFGDVGDFGKYGLLRALCGISPSSSPPLELGIVWYLFPNEGHNDDGKHIAYLVQRERFDGCDADLYSWLTNNFRRDDRRVALLHGAGLFSSTTVYCDASTGFGALHYSERPAARAAWLEATLAATANCDLVFCDPDNGIASEPRRLLAKRGGKFIGLDEVRAFHERGQSVVVYHHADRSAKLPVQAERRAAELVAATGASNVHTLAFHRGTARLYFILPAERHASHIQDRLDAFIQSPWQRHFSRPLTTGH